MKYIVDIDGTICTTVDGDYENSVPLPGHIEKINKLYGDGHYITYWTARGSASGRDWSDLTHRQLKNWGCMYHSLILKKPVYDVWIDDKAVFSGDFFK